MTSSSGNDFNSGHHVLHHGVVHLLADQPFDVALTVDAQEVNQELDGATLNYKVFETIIVPMTSAYRMYCSFSASNCTECVAD